MNITPIDHSNGLLLLKQGSVLRQLDTFNLVCTYNITYLYATTLKLADLYVSTNMLDPNIISKDLHKTYTDQIEHKIDIIYNKLTFLAPPSKTKRGLFNGIGSVVKLVTGNLDYNDAVKIEQQIYNLRNKIHSIQEKSVVIAQNAISEFSTQVNKINENENKLAEIIKNVSMHSNTVYRHFNLLQVHIQIDFSLQIILDKLMLLEDAVAFAQIGIMHPSIIHSKDLITDMLDLKSNFSFTAVAPISLENIQKIEKSIEVKAYSTGHSLNFILEIPSVDSTPYNLIHIYSIPNDENITIIPKSQYLVLGSGEYTYINEECRHISDETQVCKQLIMKQLEDNGDCITSIIQHQPAHPKCEYAKMKLTNGKFQNISPNSWLVITNNNEVLKSTCGSDVTYHTLTKTQLISISNECRAEVLNITLQTHSSAVTIHDVIPLPEQQSKPNNEIKYEIQLEDISLDSLHQLKNRANDLDEDDYKDQLVSFTPSWTTILLYCIGAVFLIWKTYKYFTCRESTPLPAASGDTPERTSGTLFYLKEGGVSMP